MQTAFHVSGAGTYYQQKDIDPSQLPESLKSRNFMGCCIHPQFGGFFSIRAAIITESEERIENSSQVNLTTDEVTQILIELNTDWQKGY